MVSTCPWSFAGSSLAFAAIMRVASLEPYAPASFEYAVAKWLCQKSVIFSWSGRALWTIRKSQRWRASLMTVFGENVPRVVTRHVARLPDERVDVVVELLVVDERLHGGVSARARSSS